MAIQEVRGACFLPLFLLKEMVVGAYQPSLLEQSHDSGMIRHMPLSIPDGVGVEIASHHNRQVTEPFRMLKNRLVHLPDVPIFRTVAVLASPDS
jgi:hypothetical protein